MDFHAFHLQETYAILPPIFNLSFLRHRIKSIKQNSSQTRLAEKKLTLSTFVLNASNIDPSTTKTINQPIINVHHQ